MDSSLLLLLPNNILTTGRSFYKIIESSILQEIFPQNHVNHAMRNELRKNVKQKRMGIICGFVVW